MNRKFWMAAFVAAAFLLGGCGTPKVETMVAQKVRAPLVFTATVVPEALFSLPVIPQVSGTLLAPLPDPGTELCAGDTIADIDTSQYDAQIAEGEARLASQPAAAPSLEEDGSMEASLLQQGIITRAEYEKLRGKKSRTVAVSGNEAMESALAAAKNARAACHITKIYVQKNVAQAGQPLLLIRQDSPVIAEIEIPRDIVAAVDEAKEKRTLTVSLTDADRSRVWFGELKKEGEEAGSPFAVYRVQADNPDGTLIIGEKYDLRIDTGRETEGISVPTKAIFDGNKVQIVTEDGLLDIRSVIVGADAGENTLIIGGLEEGDHVVVSPDTKLSVGTKVKEDL